MNTKRIKELARQSGALPTQDCGVPQWYIDEDEFEKFAELVIKECALQILNERKHFNPTEWDQGADWGFKESANVIKKHFGVE